MPERIKESWLDGQLERLNSITNRHYGFYKAYGRIQLVINEHNAGGISTVSFMHTKREMYDVLNGILEVLSKESQPQDKDINPERKKKQKIKFLK